jgi:hypothetical protein
MLIRLVETGYIDFEEAYEMNFIELNATVKGRQALESREVERQKLFFGSLLSTYISAHTKKGAHVPTWDEIFKPASEQKKKSDIDLDKLKALQNIFGGTLEVK